MVAVSGARGQGPMTHANGEEMGIPPLLFLPWPPSWRPQKVNPINTLANPSPANRTHIHIQPEDLEFGDAKAMLDGLGNV